MGTHRLSAERHSPPLLRLRQRLEPLTQLLERDKYALLKDRGLFDKLEWHRGYERICNSPLPTDLVVQRGLLLPKIRSITGTTARGVVDMENSGEVFRHLTGRYSNFLFGVKGGFHEHYYKAGLANSHLGLPISDEYETPEGWQQNFEAGTVAIARTNPSRVDELPQISIERADMLAVWSAMNLKRTTEPVDDVKVASPSKYGSSALYTEFRDQVTNQRHGLVRHNSGPFKWSLVYLDGWDWEYYLSIGGTNSEIGLPLPVAKVETDLESMIICEGGEIVWTREAGYSVRVRPKKVSGKS